jgi:hypothetical protein
MCENIESPSVLKHRFRASVVEMNARGLRHASKFLCEQLVGLAAMDASHMGDDLNNVHNSGHGCVGGYVDGDRGGADGSRMSTPSPSPQSSPRNHHHHHHPHQSDHALGIAGRTGGIDSMGVRSSSSMHSGAGADTTAIPAPAAAPAPLTPNDADQALLAQTLMATGEYQRCAYILRRGGGRDLPPQLLFMSSYSLYMSGEKLREQQAHEKRSDGASDSLHAATAKVHVWMRHSHRVQCVDSGVIFT